MHYKEKISVIIPILNGERLIETCLTSVLNQDIPIHECIVVDNHSTDRTAEIVKKMQQKHANLMYVYEPVVGRGAARNKGVCSVTGDIIAMTDVDCVVSKDWLRTLTEPIILGKEFVVVGGQYDLGGTYWSRHVQKMYEFDSKKRISPDGYVFYIDTKNVAISKALLVSNIFDIRIKAMEDFDLDLRLHSQTKFRFLETVRVGHIHPQTPWAVMKMSYERAYWFAQIYHKYKGVYGSDGKLLFPVIPALFFYTRLLKVDIHALRTQGLDHALYFFIFDLSWKIGSAIGYAHIDSAMKTNKK